MFLVTRDDEGRQHIEKNLGHPTGLGNINRGECPLGSVTPMACMLCAYGHMLDCHYPKTCTEAKCSHYESEMEEEE